MEHKHTSGPWRVCDPMSSDKTYGIDGTDGTAVVWFGSTHQEGIRRIEDARLIAAAPDLLNVAQWARDAMRQAFDEVLQMFPEGGVVPPWMATLETTIADAEHAIAKATGAQSWPR